MVLGLGALRWAPNAERLQADISQRRRHLGFRRYRSGVEDSSDVVQRGESLALSVAAAVTTGARRGGAHELFDIVLVDISE